MTWFYVKISLLPPPQGQNDEHLRLCNCPCFAFITFEAEDTTVHSQVLNTYAIYKHLKLSTYLSFWSCRCGWVHENSSILESPVHICYH